MEMLAKKRDKAQLLFWASGVMLLQGLSATVTSVFIFVENSFPRPSLFLVSLFVQ